jgi:16S rRNA (guanine527-N7)-methyltransferase
LSTISDLTGPQQSSLEAYAALVRVWAPQLDLVAPGDLFRLEDRHLEDSLRAVRLIESAPEGPCVDVGSGAGLPGIPLAIATERAWRLLEPRQKRAAFLEEVVRELGLNAEVVPRSAAEAVADPTLREHAVATVRAVAPPEEALALSVPLVRGGGRVILWVGKRADFPRDADVSPEGLASIDVVTR